MTNKVAKSTVRRLLAAVVLAGVLASGGALAPSDTTIVQAGDGPPRCC